MEQARARIDQEISGLLRLGAARGSFDYPAIERLAHQGADPNGRSGGSSMLHALAECSAEGAEVMARLLISFGADPGALDGAGRSPLALAALGGHLSMARELLRAGADPAERGPGGADAMSCALERGDDDLAQALLEAGYPAKGAKSIDGTPALACVAGRASGGALAFELIHRGADPDQVGRGGWTALGVACREGCAPMASLLISEGADPWLAGPAGLSPMALALGAKPGNSSGPPSRVSPGHLACAVRLARSGKPGWGSEPDAMGMPPLARLCQSIRRFEPTFMRELRVAGADPLASESDGSTLLARCAGMKREDSALALARWALEAGVDPGRPCLRGILPERAAADKEFWQLEALLRSERERSSIGGAAERAEPMGEARRL